MPHRQRQTHARDGPGLRLIRSSEIGVGVEVRESDPTLLTPGTKQAPQHDAAIAPRDDHEPTIVKTAGNPIRQRATVARHAILVPSTTGRPNEIPIGGWHHVAKILGVEPFHQTKLAENAGRVREVASLTALVVGTDADA